MKDRPTRGARAYAVRVKWREALAAVLFVGCGGGGLSAGLAVAGDATIARLIGALIGSIAGILLAAGSHLFVTSWLDRRQQRDSGI
jgi:hypothetical protein